MLGIVSKPVTPGYARPMLLGVPDFEEAAARVLPSASMAFISGGAGEGRSRDANVEALEALPLRPRVLVDVGERSQESLLLGQRIAFPILVAPSAMHRIAHPDGELATVRAAGRLGTAMVLSLGSSYPVEAVMAEATGPVWFQAYVGRDRVATADVVARAEESGCSALVVTVDAPVVGGRFDERRTSFEVLPEWFAPGHDPLYGLTAPVASGRAATELWDPTLSWGDLEWLRSITRMPLVLKGVLRSDDADRAAAEGVDGLVVSNHGGRQLEASIASVTALPGVVDAVDGRCAVLVDGGIRRGSDVVRALALGADAVLVGRPILWGLAVDGQNGVERVLSTLSEELDLVMALCGARNLSEVTPDLLGPVPGQSA